MADYAIAPQALADNVTQALGELAQDVTVALDEVTVTVSADNYLQAMQRLREHEACAFDMLIDLCGLDYSTWKNRPWAGKRFAVAVHLLSIRLNQRLRVRVFCADDEFPLLPSLVNIWAAVNWFEREAFDLYGIVFEGHPDLRRILTDYGFIGHPFRKDFPLSGYTEMRYDAERQRVIYQPVTIEPREVTPRVVREEKYAGFGAIPVQQTQTHG